MVLHPQVYCAATTLPGRATYAVAARLHLGEDAVFSHLTAGRLLRIAVETIDERAWLTTAIGTRPAHRPGVVVTRATDMTRVTSRWDQPVFDVPRTVVDLARVLDAERLTGVLFDVCRRGATTVTEILAVAEAVGRRPGSGLLRRVADEFDPAYDSGLEAEAAGHFVRAGLALESQHEVLDGWWLLARLDFADVERRLGIEIDGHRHHSSRAARERAARRDAELRRRGWVVLRFTSDDVRRRPADMIATILREMAAIDALRARRAG